MNAAETKLVKALTSGKYEQTDDRLRSDNYFCCLGVACDISKKGRWTDGDDYTSFKKVLKSSGNFFWDDIALPGPVRSWLDWSSENGMLSFWDRNEGVITLADLNDEGTTFDQIADIIKANLVQKTKEGMWHPELEYGNSNRNS